jgi:hypothetical protein
MVLLTIITKEEDDTDADQLGSTWMEAFLAARQTGQASWRGSHALHRHRWRHGSSSTDDSPLPARLARPLGGCRRGGGGGVILGLEAEGLRVLGVSWDD